MAGLGSVEKPRLIVAGGGYDPGRMSSKVVDALAQLSGNYALVFTGMELGKPQRNACEEQLVRNNIDHRVIFLETLSCLHVLKLYAASDVGILLYPNSGIGHFYQAPGRLTEYLRCGLPFVTSHFPGLKLLTLTYNLGAIADPYDPASIAAAIRRVGDVPDADLAARRTRLIDLATSELVYETQAEPVFTKVFGMTL